MFFFVAQYNPNMRVVIIKDYVKEHFPSTPLLDYALEVEKITTSKVKSLSLPPRSLSLPSNIINLFKYRSQI